VAHAAPETPVLTGAWLRDALEHTGLSVMAADAHGRINLISPGLRDLFRIPDEEQLDDLSLDDEGTRSPLPVHLDGTEMALWDTPLARALGGEYVKNAILGSYDIDGTLIWLECNAFPLLDDHGRPDGGAVLMQDVTARIEAERLAEELRRRLVHTVNHEFRTPLAALLGNLEVVRDHHAVDADLARSLEAIERNAWRLCHLVGTAASLIEKQEELHRQGLQPDGAPYRP
jgi:signal transduction histidine kinase